ncbi:Delta-type opioid receptor [Merluccius polli]|uniref:Delta-type opioid receptor n=1 Tax=Merluccius polli TaxID=89951 RepID=A0AA47MDF5_MERPO|nr:Delta-type opioid receptor [Merluccius polli]
MFCCEELNSTLIKLLVVLGIGKHSTATFGQNKLHQCESCCQMLYLMGSHAAAISSLLVGPADQPDHVPYRSNFSIMTTEAGPLLSSTALGQSQGAAAQQRWCKLTFWPTKRSNVSLSVSGTDGQKGFPAELKHTRIKPLQNKTNSAFSPVCNFAPPCAQHMETFTVPRADLADFYSVVPFNSTDGMSVAAGYGPSNDTGRPTPVARSASGVVIAISITALYSVICVVGLLGNILVMYGVVSRVRPVKSGIDKRCGQ